MSQITTQQIEAEFAALTQTAVVADLSSRTRIRVTGSDRVGFLNGFCTADVKKLAPLAGCEAFFTGHQGKAAGHGYIYSREQSLIIDTTAGQFEKLSNHLKRFAITEDVEFADETANTCELLLAGKLAAEIVKQLFGVETPTQRLSTTLGRSGDLSAEIVVTDFTGTLEPSGAAYLLLAKTEDKQSIIELLKGAGVALVSEELMEGLRIEAGTPVYGNEIDDDTLPQEMNRDALAISFKKGCYLGQETVARIDALGHVNRVLVRLKLQGDSKPTKGTPLMLRDDAGVEKQVGTLTSVAYSPSQQCFMGLAVVRRAGSKSGTKLFAGDAVASVV